MAWMFQRAAAEAERICTRVDVMFQVRPFARQIPSAFLASLVGDLMVRTLQGKIMDGIVEKVAGDVSFKDYRGRMAHLRGTLIEDGRRWFVEDYSRVEGEGDLLAFKLKVIRFMMDGIREEAELERIFDEGEGVLRPHLEESSGVLEGLGAHRPSVFLMGASGLDDREQVSRTGRTLKALDEMRS